MNEDRPINRRSFFRAGLGELLRPLVQAAQPLEEVIRQISSIDAEVTAAKKAMSTNPAAPAQGNILGAPQVRAMATSWLRPPGALEDAAFLETCSRCGECARVCPVRCIQIDPNGAKGNGAPYIDIDTMPCVMCDGLLCMHNCPTGALTPIPIGEIDMGVAGWHESTCVRTHGQECTICVDRCPIGEVAIELLANPIHVKEAGCTGCGVCQHHCPTTPKSITITPRSTGSVSRGRPNSLSRHVPRDSA